MIKPILFNTEMVKAIMDGRKTQTRRLVKEIALHAPYFELYDDAPYACDMYGEWHPAERFCRIRPRDILWVRETWRPAKGNLHTYIRGEVVESDDWHDGFEYKAGGYHFPDGFKESDDVFHLSEIRSEGNWHPSIHMPKEAARIFLKVKDVRAERLHEITQQQAIAEGIPSRICKVFGLKYKDNEEVEHDQRGIELCIADFAKIWDSTIKPADIDTYGWNANPWVWVIEFERCEKPKGWYNA